MREFLELTEKSQKLQIQFQQVLQFTQLNHQVHQSEPTATPIRTKSLMCAGEIVSTKLIKKASSFTGVLLDPLEVVWEQPMGIPSFTNGY